MKIYMLGPTWPYRGGISHYTTLLFRTLKKQHSVVLGAVKRQYPMWLYPGQTDKDLSRTRLEEPGVDYILDSMNPLSWFRVIRHIQKQRPHMVIIPWWVSFWTLPYWVICLGIKAMRQPKIVFICHNVVEHESSRFGQLCTRLVLRMGDYFIAHSQEVRDSLLYLVPKANVRVKAHPNYAFFKTETIDREGERKRLGFAPEHIVLMFFGFIRKYKGVPVLLNAMKELAADIPNLRLLLTGEAWHEEEDIIQRQITDYGLQNCVIRKNEYIVNEDVERLYAASDIAVFPYTSATGSGALQVALAMEKPVIASDLSCFAEIVTDGETGFLVPPGDAQAIAAAVRKYLDNGALNAKLINEMRSNIIELNKQFSWDSMAAEITGLLE